MNIYKGVIDGKGVDVVGSFKIHGDVQITGKILFTKHYDGGHTVNYEGQLNYRQITGKWSMPAFNVSDEFYI
jgi:hypothetical protein